MINIWKALLLEQYIRDIISEQEDNGWYFDVELAKEHIAFLEKESDRLYNHIRPNLSYTLLVPYAQSINDPFKKNGDYTQHVYNWMGDDVNLIAGPFTRVVFEEPNLGSDKQLKEQLYKLGWEPDEWNYKKDKKNKIVYDENRQPIKTSPKLTESSYDSLTVGIGPDLALYLKVIKRKSTIEGYLKNVREDNTISAQANTLGTPTARFRHRIVVNVPKAKESVFFGKECRSLFTHRPGRCQVGHDASGLESRMEAHETYNINKEYALELLHGDVHQKNANEWGVERDLAKNGKYAVTYGAYPPKLAATLKIPLRIAKKIFEGFWDDKNPLTKLHKKLKRFWKKHGWIEGLDGRPIFVRKESDLINYRFQSNGAIVMKVSIFILDRWKKKLGIDAIKVGDFHDEGQADVALHQAKMYGTLAVNSIRKAGEVMRLRIPLDADYKIGNNWAETH